MKEYALDIGTGKGGKYLGRLSEKYTVIAFDLNHRLLAQVDQYHQIYPVAADATHGLPFPDNQFTFVNIVLPFRTLLIALMDPSSSFFEEIYRIMQPNAKLNIVTDVPVNRDEYEIPCGKSGESITVLDHHRRVVEAIRSRREYSKVKIYRLPSEQANALGTMTSRLMAPGSSSMRPHFYRIKAKKRIYTYKS